VDTFHVDRLAFLFGCLALFGGSRMTKRCLIALYLVFCGWPAWAQIPNRLDVALAVEADGYFERCRSGEMRGCSYFARLVAWRLNPNGDPSSWGTLRKTAGGSNVEGYADDAIVYGQGNNNVIDLVGSAGVPGASVYWGTADNAGTIGHQRRASDIWEAPQPLTAAMLAYLKPGSQTTPAPTPFPSGAWTPAHAAVLTRFRADAPTREVAEQFAFSFPGESWGQKAATPDRPLSGDVIARRYDDGRLVGFRVVPPSAHPMQFDLAGQHFVPVARVDHLGMGTAPPVPPVEPGPSPPSADLQPLLDAIAALSEKVEQLEGTINGFGTSVLPALSRIEQALDAQPTTPASGWPEYVGSILGRTVVLSPRAPR
jgi:hypothetical protein